MVTYDDIKGCTRAEIIDISSEVYRVYMRDNQVIIKIDQPVALGVCANGTHIVTDSIGTTYEIIPVCWNNIRTKHNYL